MPWRRLPAPRMAIGEPCCEDGPRSRGTGGGTAGESTAKALAPSMRASIKSGVTARRLPEGASGAILKEDLRPAALIRSAASCTSRDGEECCDAWACACAWRCDCSLGWTARGRGGGGGGRGHSAESPSPPGERPAAPACPSIPDGDMLMPFRDRIHALVPHWGTPFVRCCLPPPPPTQGRVAQRRLASARGPR